MTMSGRPTACHTEFEEAAMSRQPSPARLPGQTIPCGWCRESIAVRSTGRLPKWCSRRVASARGSSATQRSQVSRPSTWYGSGSCLQRLGGLSCPVIHLADDPERIPAAVPPGGVTSGWSRLGRPRTPRRLDGVHTGSALTRRELRGEPGAVRQGGEVDVVHHHFGPVVRPEARPEEVTHPQVSFRAVEERTFSSSVRTRLTNGVFQAVRAPGVKRTWAQPRAGTVGRRPHLYGTCCGRAVSGSRSA